MKRRTFFLAFIIMQTFASEEKDPKILWVTSNILDKACSFVDRETTVFAEISGHEGFPSVKTLCTLKESSHALYGLSGQSSYHYKEIAAHVFYYGLHCSPVDCFYNGQVLGLETVHGVSNFAASTAYGYGIVFAGKRNKDKALSTFLAKAKITLPKKVLIIDWDREKLEAIKTIFTKDLFFQHCSPAMEKVEEVTLFHLDDDE